MKTSLHIISIILFSLFVVSIVGCGGDEPTPEPTPEEKLSGTYSLLNVAFSRGGTAFTMEPPFVSGKMHLNAQGSWLLQVTWNDPSFEADDLSGLGFAWTADNEKITFDDGGAIPYTLSGDTLVLIFDDLEDGYTMELSWDKQD